MDGRFAARADEFIARVQSAAIGPATEVYLVHHCVNQDGSPVEPFRTSLVATTSVKYPGKPVLELQLAAAAHRDTIVGNINSLVRHASPGLVRHHAGPPHPVIIRDFSIEIAQPADEPTAMPPAPPVGLSVQGDPVPLRTDPGGAVRVGRSRVSLDLVVGQYENGMTPEAMVRAYDTLNLTDVYAVIAYYLRHRAEVRAYLARRGAEAAALRAEVEADRPRVSRAELLARRGLGEVAHAPTGQ